MTTQLEPTEIVRLYRIWTSILYRCGRKENKQYKNYGARGINICNEWMDFNQFCKDIGEGSKKGLHLDRVDNNKGYSKENCRWVLPKDNHRNKRNNTYYKTHIGKICQSQLIEMIGYTRRQFQRALEKYGIREFLEMFQQNRLPKKRIVPDLSDIVGTTISGIFIKSLDPNKSTGARYFCICHCGNETRVSRFKLINGLANDCPSCCRRGDKNPNSRARKGESRCI